MSRVEEFHIVSRTATSGPGSIWSPFYRGLTLATIFGMVFGGLLLLQPINTSAQSAAVVTEPLNLRNGPSLDDGIIAVMPAGASVTLDGGSQNGYLSLSYNGTWGWGHADWISTSGSAPVDNSGATGTAYVFDGALNLRSGPSTSNSVITVMPDGAAVSLTGQSSGGFLSVVYNGTSGWAFADYLSTSGSSAPSEPSQPSNPGVGDTVVGSMVTTDNLNMRSGPDTSYGIITTVTTGNTVELMGDPQNGFYPVRYGGNKGWMHGSWLTSGGSTTPETPEEPSDPGTTTGTMVTTARLNVRTQANTTSAVVTVLDVGTTVEITGAGQNGFLPVRVGSTNGWAHGGWLTSDSGSTPTEPSNPGVGDTVVGEMRVSVGLHLRQGPGTSYSSITIMPGGATVQIMGDAQNGFYPVSFHGTKGWASGEYLTTGDVSVPGDGGTDYTRDEIVQIIYAAADQYGQPRADMLRVAGCESVLDPNAVNPYSNASGLFQFLPSTWATTPYANEDIFDPVANAEAAAWMWANGRRNEWVCQ